MNIIIMMLDIQNYGCSGNLLCYHGVVLLLLLILLLFDRPRKSMITYKRYCAVSELLVHVGCV